MLIHNTKSTFVYDGGSEFDLINPPEVSNYQLYVDYSNFINKIIAIYGDQRGDDRIPIFWTKQRSDTSISRVADPDSTLRSLIPGKVYYIICLNDTVLPLYIPETTNSKEFLKINPPKPEPSEVICEQVIPVSTHYRDINLSKSSGSTLPLNIEISGIFPNKNYLYTIAPIFSNWPATVTQMSGYLERGGPIGSDGLISSSIKTILSYESCETISQCTGNIPYSLIDTDNNYFHKNIFTLLNINIYDETSSIVFTDTINILCDDCIPLLDYTVGKKYNPTLNINQSQFELTLNNFVDISASYNKINPFNTYSYSFESVDANWPCRIRNISGSFVPEYVYKDTDGKLYGSGTIKSIFTFATSSGLSDPNWSNLDYTLETYSDQNFIKNNLYAALKLIIKDDTDSELSSCFTSVRCVDCFPYQTDCSALSLKINDTNLSYNTLTDTSRPGAEITLEQSCCDRDQHIYVDITGACPTTVYNYKFTSYPDILISPSSGYFSFSAHSGRISAVANLNGQDATTIQFTAQQSGTNTFATDSMIMRCRPITITVSNINHLTQGLSGQYYLSPNLDINGSYYWSKDAQDSWPRIWNPGSSILPPPSDNYWFISSSINDISILTTGILYPNTPFGTYYLKNDDSYNDGHTPNYNGSFILSTNLDINGSHFYSLDGLDSWPRIYRPGTGLLSYYSMDDLLNGLFSSDDQNLLWVIASAPPSSGLSVPLSPPMNNPQQSQNDSNMDVGGFFSSPNYPLPPQTTGIISPQNVVIPSQYPKNSDLWVTYAGFGTKLASFYDASSSRIIVYNTNFTEPRYSVYGNIQ